MTEKDRQRRILYMKRYRVECKDKVREYTLKYQKKNRLKLNQYCRIWQALKLEKQRNPYYLELLNLRSQIIRSLKEKGEYVEIIHEGFEGELNKYFKKKLKKIRIGDTVGIYSPGSKARTLRAIDSLI